MNENFEKRMTNHRACKAVDLNDAELSHYHGVGDTLVAVNSDAQITAVFYLENNIFDGDKIATIMQRCRDFADSQIGQIYQGIMSSQQFCEPKVIDVNNNDQLAGFVCRVFGDL